ncbi:MAG: hypothetical protein ACK4GW_14975 [Pseudorhodobacter sp.]
MTMPCVAHETGFASKLADRVIVMDRGELVEEANPEAFLNALENVRSKPSLVRALRH